MTDKEKTIKELKEALDGLDITNKYRLNIIRAIEYLQEEPVSEELEDAADKYSQSIHSDYSNDMFDCHNIYDAVIYGAQWQKERDEDEIRMIRELLDNFDKTCDEYHDAGFKHGQEALMKDAVEATVHGVSGREGSTMKGIAVTAYADVPDCKFGDKVKVIIIKEE